MKRLLAAALLFAAPLTALAAPNGGPMIHPTAPKTQVTGVVKVAYPRCMGCMPVVSIQGAQGTMRTYTRISGEMALDLAAFDGKVVTVKGTPGDNNSLDANGFAPGDSDKFVTGTVELASPNCPPNARCAQKVYLNTGDRKILVKDGYTFGLTGLEGAKVTLRGDVTQYCCGPGVRCMGSEPTLTVDADRNILVRGRIEKFAHGMNGQTHSLTLDNGETVLVSGKKWEDRNFATVWLSGKMTTERISGRPMLKATSASAAVPVIPAIEPRPIFPVTVGDGANVARDAGTAGGVGSGASTNAAAGAGTLRN